MPLASASSTLGVRSSSSRPPRASAAGANFGRTSAALKSATAGASTTASAAASHSAFLEATIIKSVHASLARQDLPAERPRPAPAAGQGRFGRVGAAVAEGPQLVLVFSGQNRAGHIQKLTPAPEQGPQPVQQARLGLDKARDIRGLAPKLDVGVAADDAGRRAWGVEQNAIERPPVPPGLPGAGVAHDDPRLGAEASEILPDQPGAGGGGRERD